MRALSRPRKPLAAAVLGAFLVIPVALPLAGQSGQAQAAEHLRTYAIAAGPLGAVLSRFASEAGVVLSFDAGLTQGRQSPGLQGRYAVSDGFARLLEGSGLIVVESSAGDYLLMPPPETSALALPGTTISAQSAGETAWGPVDGYVARRSATGTKTDASLLEVPQSVSVVTRAQMAAQGAQNVEDAIAYTPGIHAGSYGPNPQHDFVFSRGFDAPLFLDGTRLYRDYVTGAQMRMDPYGLERVEVLRGPASVLYGQITPGGMLNQVSKRPLAEPLREVQVQAGTFDRTQIAADIGDALDEEGKVLFRLTGLWREAQAQMDYARDDRQFIAPALSLQFSDDTRLTLLSHYQKDSDALRPVPLPAQGTLYGNPHGELDRDLFLGEPSFDDFDREQYSLGYILDHTLNDAWSVQQNLRYSHADTVEKFSLPMFDWNFPADLRTVDRQAWDDRNQIGVVSLDNQLHGRVHSGELQHDLLFGADYWHASNDWQFESADMPSIDAYAPQYGGPLGPFTRYIDQEQRERQSSLYAQDQIRFQRWLLTLGLRHDWARASTEDLIYATRTTQSDEKTTGRVGLTYLFDNGLAPYVSYSTSFEPEAGTDGSGKPFEPTTGEQYEVGVKYQPNGSEAFVALSLFDLTRENVLTRDPNPPASNPYAQTQTGEARTRGVELEAKLQPIEHLDVLAAYTYFDSEVTESTTDNLGKPLFFTPRNQLALWADYHIVDGPLRGLSIGAGGRYRDQVYGLNYEIEVPSFTLYDASLRYNLGQLDQSLQGLNAAVNVRNLFDKEYIATCSYYEGCYYGEQRTVTASLNYRW